MTRIYNTKNAIMDMTLPYQIIGEFLDLAWVTKVRDYINANMLEYYLPQVCSKSDISVLVKYCIKEARLNPPMVIKYLCHVMQSVYDTARFYLVLNIAESHDNISQTEYIVLTESIAAYLHTFDDYRGFKNRMQILAVEKLPLH